MGFGLAWLIMDTLTTVLKLGAYSPRREKEHAHSIKTRPMSQDIFHIWIRPAWGSHPSRQLSLSSSCCVLRGEGAGQILIDSDLGHIRIYGRRKRCKHLCFASLLSIYLSIHPSIHLSLSPSPSISLSNLCIYIWLELPWWNFHVFFGTQNPLQLRPGTKSKWLTKTRLAFATSQLPHGWANCDGCIGIGP